MAKMVRVIGVNKILSNLKIANAQTSESIERGLKKAGTYIQGQSQRIVPVDTTNLKGSARTDSTGKGWDTKVVVHYGAGADYAVYVHEDLNARHKKGKRAKFLESVVRENLQKIFEIVGRG